MPKRKRGTEKSGCMCFKITFRRLMDLFSRSHLRTEPLPSRTNECASVGKRITSTIASSKGKRVEKRERTLQRASISIDDRVEQRERKSTNETICQEGKKCAYNCAMKDGSGGDSLMVPRFHPLRCRRFASRAVSAIISEIASTLGAAFARIR